MRDDFLTDLGLLSFVTRLKRVSDSMLHDGRKLYKELGMDIEPNWYVIFKLLEKECAMTVTEIADRIGFAHPSVITIVNKMIKRGYLESTQCERDSRRRFLKLTDKAKKKLPEFEKVWSAGVAGVKRMLEDADAMSFLGVLEERIGETGFRERTLACLKDEKRVKVHEFEPRFARAFADLNYEWISEMYVIEEHDREQLENPDLIVGDGGEILIATVDGEPVGTAALISMPDDEDAYELAKMAVSRKFRGFRIGKRLMEACIEYSKRVGKTKIILESNRKQLPAINLYRKFGFVEIEQDPNTHFERADIRMLLDLMSNPETVLRA